MRVLQIISSVRVGNGGVLEAVHTLTEGWLRDGHTVEVLTLDPPGYEDVRSFPVSIHMLGPSHSKWQYSAAFYPWLRDHHGEYDFVLVHGLWQYHVYASWRALHDQSTPYAVFPHGMLDPYFKHISALKHAKKWLFWPWSEYRLLRDASAVMFTCEVEKVLARKSFALYKAKELVVGFGSKKPDFQLGTARDAFLLRFPELHGKRLLTFMGRLHPKKACDLLIEAFAHTLGNDPVWHLVMVGPDLDSWQKELVLLAVSLKMQDRITWTGMMQGELKWGALAASEALALPSHQENFGIVIAEALACGVPVIISDKVNIWREIAASETGLISVDNLAGIEAALLRWSELSDTERQDMRARCVPCFQNYFDIQTVCARVMTEIERIVKARKH